MLPVPADTVMAGARILAVNPAGIGPCLEILQIIAALSRTAAVSRPATTGDRCKLRLQFLAS
jgi:hypothetical protein